MLEAGNRFYVRIDHKIEGKKMLDQDFYDSYNYCKNISQDRYLVAGFFTNSTGAMVLFEAKNLEEAKKIAQNDPIIERGIYRAEVFEWEMMLLSDKV